MRKHLIGTILVLAALAACNKEVETPAPVVNNGQEEVTPGKVTLTFTATISEETRTAYPDDKTGKWVVGDKITVCVSNNDSNNPKYKTAVFEATTETATGMEFTGQVQTGYTTIVSGIYPANDVYKGESMSTYFGNDGSVIGVNLPDTYDLDTANDTGRYIPMVGEMVHDNDNDTDTFTFHHICGALKIEVVDIFNALTFTTAETITGTFVLNSGRIKIPAEGSGSTVTFNYDRLATNIAGDERGNRTFYIPVPDGTLTAGATMALKNANKTSTFFDKTTTAAIEFNSNKIKRLPAIGFNTPEGWAIDIIDGNVGQKITINYTFPAGTYYARFLVKKSTFINTYEGSVAKLIEKKLPELSTFSNNTYNGSNIETYFAEKDYISFMFGVIPSDPSNPTNVTGRKISFEYCKLEYSFEEPTLEYKNWIGKWNVTEDATDPKTDTWTISTKKANSTYIIKGIAGKTAIAAEGVYSADDASLALFSQYEIGTHKNGSTTYTVSMLKRNSSGNVLTDETGNAIGLRILKMHFINSEVSFSNGENSNYGFFFEGNNGWSTFASLKRNKIATMTKQ
jgi:hypothetical protein